MSYTEFVYQDDDGYYIALCPAFPGCIGSGLSESEAITDLELAREDYIQSLIEDGLSVPEPFSDEMEYSVGTY